MTVPAPSDEGAYLLCDADWHPGHDSPLFFHENIKSR
jgi:hypothetical protein